MDPAALTPASPTKTKRAPRKLLEEPPSTFSSYFPFPARCYESLAAGISRGTPCPLRLGFFRRRGRGRLVGRFPAGPAEKRQGILGAGGEAANVLFRACTQGNVDEPVACQAHGRKAVQDF